MKRARLLLLILVFIGSMIQLKAQIGYQVTLLNTATGEPRSLETITVDVSIEDSKGNIILKSSKKETSNEFGILSLIIGDENTFNNVNWNNLPLFVSASVDGIMLGKTQILNVPIAEFAKRIGGTLNKEMLASKDWYFETQRLTFDYGTKESPNPTTEWKDYTYQFKRNNELTIVWTTHMYSHSLGIDNSHQYQNTSTYFIYGDLIISDGKVIGYYDTESHQLCIDTGVFDLQ